MPATVTIETGETPVLVTLTYRAIVGEATSEQRLRVPPNGSTEVHVTELCSIGVEAAPPERSPPDPLRSRPAM